MLVSLVGGRAAEEVVFDTVTTGAANDIEKATDIARNMVTRYGMSKKFGLMGLATVESQYLEGRTALNCSDATAAQIDAEVVEILKGSYDKALELIRENRGVMDKLAEFLIEKETITGKEFMQIFRREKGLPEPEEDKSGAEGQKESGQDGGKVVSRHLERAEEGRPEGSDSGADSAGMPDPSATGPNPVSGAPEPETAPGGRELSPAEDGMSAQGEAHAARNGMQGREDSSAATDREGISRGQESAMAPGTAFGEQESGGSEESAEPEEQKGDDRPVGRFSNGRID